MTLAGWGRVAKRGGGGDGRGGWGEGSGVGSLVRVIGMLKRGADGATDRMGGEVGTGEE